MHQRFSAFKSFKQFNLSVGNKLLSLHKLDIVIQLKCGSSFLTGKVVGLWTALYAGKVNVMRPRWHYRPVFLQLFRAVK